MDSDQSNATRKHSNKLKKKRDGTPDKTSSPGADDEGTFEQRLQVLNNEEIQNLAIKQEELDKIRQEALEELTARKKPQPPPKQIAVKRVNQTQEVKKPAKVVIVAKGAPPRAPLKPIETEGNCGPRFDSNGNLISHSILGTLEEYKVTAQKLGQLKVDYYLREQDRVQTPSVKYERPVKERVKYPLAESTSQSNALINWQKKMRERKLQQGYISNLLQQPAGKLAMNQADTYRHKQELRYLIDRSIAAVDYGKGYRVGSEFWKQRELIGDEETGIHVTLAKTEQGYPAAIEHIGVPSSIVKEKELYDTRPSSSLNKPWHKSNFLKERMEQLHPVMTDLDPHKPDIQSLEIIGSNPYVRYLRAMTPASENPRIEVVEEAEPESDPLSAHPDVYSTPIFGPCIKFAGHVLQWTGNSENNKGLLAADVRVGFEALAGCRSTTTLDIENLGTTAIYYSWKMLPKSNPFDLVNAKVQRFYFNTSNGVILPGSTLKFPFVFKSDKAGVYTEQWQFVTHPSVMDGASLVASLRGIALREDKHKKQRDLLEASFQRNILEQNVRFILDEIVDSIKERERPRSPIDCYITEKQIFERQNPQLCYKTEIVENLKSLYNAFINHSNVDTDEDGNRVVHGEKSGANLWNLSLTEFKRGVLELAEEDPQKAPLLENINKAVIEMSFANCTPKLLKLYQKFYQNISSSLDNLSSHSNYLRSLLGLPEHDQDDRTEESHFEPSEQEQLSVPEEYNLENRRDSMTCSIVSSPAVSARRRMSGPQDIDNNKNGKPGQGSKAAPAKATPKAAAAKEEKKSGKTEPKKDTKKETVAKKNDRASPTKKPATSGNKLSAVSSTQAINNEGRITPADGLIASSPVQPYADPSLQKKYMEKLYCLVYNEVSSLFLHLYDAHEEINARMAATE